ncbi:hypothetical protein [Streptomyces sp. HUAS ZL42]|uniref:hypothetical protein n=1 Tax=Streptomyces sp. HUAS ZL42 TaxID=3231715 RepID=UPI00345E162F
MPQTVITWLELWRSVVLEPLRAADPPWTLEQIAGELGRRTGGSKAANAARGDTSGTAKATLHLQKFFAGERVPTRDVVQHLLDIAAETLEEPPTKQQVHELWSAYRAALRITFSLLADLYDAVDARDAALHKASHLQRSHDQLAADLERSERHQQRLQTLLGHTHAELDRAERVAEIRRADAGRWREEVQRLTAQVHDLESERDRMHQDMTRLQQELERVRDREDAAAASAGRLGELEAARATLVREGQEIEVLLRTVEDALHAAREQARDSASGVADLRELATQEQSRTRELEVRHATAMRAVEHLSEQLRHTSRELAEARSELVRRDGDLARLVEQHAQEIASLRASSVLAEADNVLSLALQRLDPTQALPAAPENVSAQETMPSSSSAQPGSPPSASASGRTDRDEPDLDESAGALPPPRADDGQTASAQQPGDHAHRSTRPHPDVSPGGDAGAVTPQREKRSWQRGCAVRVSAIVGTTVLILVVIWLANRWGSLLFGSRGAFASKAAASPSSLGQPAEDPVADIGTQEVNTAAIMKLRACTSTDVAPVLTSARNSYGTNEYPRLELTIKAHPDADARLPCRINLSRTSVDLTVTGAGTDAAMWRASACRTGHDGQRWVQLTRTTPATVDFHWNRKPSTKNCDEAGRARAGTYLAELLVIKQKVQTSFVLEADEPQSSPTTPSPRSSASSTDETSASGGFLGGSDNGGASSPSSSASESASTESSSAN